MMFLKTIILLSLAEVTLSITSREADEEDPAQAPGQAVITAKTDDNRFADSRDDRWFTRAYYYVRRHPIRFLVGIGAISAVLLTLKIIDDRCPADWSEETLKNDFRPFSGSYLDGREGYPLFNKVVSGCANPPFEYTGEFEKGDRFMCHEMPQELLKPWEKRVCQTLDWNPSIPTSPYEKAQKLTKEDVRCVPNHFLAGKKIINLNVEFQPGSDCDSRGKEGERCYSENLQAQLRDGARDAANQFGNLIHKEFHLIPEGDKTKPDLTIEFTKDGMLSDGTCGIAPDATDRKRKEGPERNVRINYHNFSEGKCRVMDWKGTLMHELAHKFGVQHTEYKKSSGRSSLMSLWNDLQNNIFGERYVNSFSPDDTNRIQADVAIIKKDDFEARLKHHFRDIDHPTAEDCDTFTGAETIGDIEDKPGRNYSDICKDEWIPTD